MCGFCDDSEDWEPIYDRFETPQNLLDHVATYYPIEFNAHNLDQAVYLGGGAEAYAFLVCGRVYKFTISPEHAKVSRELSFRGPTDYLVSTDGVWQLSDLGLWVIVEERLFKLPLAIRTALEEYFEGGESVPADWSQRVDNIIVALNNLGVREWDEDCVRAHNIMKNKSGDWVAFDFGFTHSHFPEQWEQWS